MIPANVAMRFWSHVQKGAPDECWPWTLSVDGHGYGKFTWPARRYHVASRIAYRLSTGVDPIGRVVRHDCDNPRCCNPAHLIVGTTQQNMDDRGARGRTQQGEGHYRAKLTIEQVAEIRASAEKALALAERMGVTRDAIYSVRSGRTWKDGHISPTTVLRRVA